MAGVTKAAEALKEDFEAADNLVDEIYNKYFSPYFKKEQELYQRFRDTDKPITDKELEWIITSLPLDLYAASDALAQFKAHNEIIKLTIKNRKKTNKDKPEEIDDEYQIMNVVYSAVINKIESKLTFSKELIMGAKKVWDARRRTEQPAIPETNIPDLPDYPIKNVYIKGGIDSV